MRGSPVTPKVELLSCTGGEQIASLAAKLCYSDASIASLQEAISKKEQDKFLSMVSQMGHHSVFEHINFTFGIEGVSRAFTHQLVRHRIASYSQKSQRYVAHTGGFDFIAPPSVAERPEALIAFQELMAKTASAYDELLQLGINPEDARYLLPNAAETKIIVTMNARELLHFFRLRCCERAQWEIRKVAEMMFMLAYPMAPNVFSIAGPACVSGQCSEGKMSCGKAAQIRVKYQKIMTAYKQVK